MRLFDPGPEIELTARDKRALRVGLRLCGACRGRGTSRRAIQFSHPWGRLDGRDRSAMTRFPIYHRFTRVERDRLCALGEARGVQVTGWERADGSSIEHATQRPLHDDRAWFRITWFDYRIACWACGGSGFNCSSELARAFEQRCHTQQEPSTTPTEGMHG